MAESVVKDVSETHDWVYTVELEVQFHITASENTEDWKQDIQQQLKSRLIELAKDDEDLPYSIINQDYFPK